MLAASLHAHQIRKVVAQTGNGAAGIIEKNPAEEYWQRILQEGSCKKDPARRIQAGFSPALVCTDSLIEYPEWELMDTLSMRNWPVGWSNNL